MEDDSDDVDDLLADDQDDSDEDEDSEEVDLEKLMAGQKRKASQDSQTKNLQPAQKKLNVPA